jgi:hypothetical protein
MPGGISFRWKRVCCNNRSRYALDVLTAWLNSVKRKGTVPRATRLPCLLSPPSLNGTSTGASK